METKEKEKYKKKAALCEKLGAKKFQKVVFQVEKMKYKILKKICPNYISYYDKLCDFQKKRALKKATSKEEADQIVQQTKFAKLAMRKEFNNEQNRNYHIDRKKPTEIYKYLIWNKSIHKSGLIKDLITIPILVGGIVVGFTPAIPLLIFELISAGINFQCINIQNYNLSKYKLVEESLKKKEAKRIKQDIEEFNEAAKVIHKTMEEKEEIPSFEDIINNIHTKEELEQLKRLLEKEYIERSKQKAKKEEIKK